MAEAAAGYVSTTNACKLCTPLGACLAFKGIEGCIPYLHGSQGCATYMRRYLISHFREPVDIASSALGEKQAIFGGGPNLKQGILNVVRKYDPDLIGVATTCLTETIGDDVASILLELDRQWSGLCGDGPSAVFSKMPPVVQVSTPSYQGTHAEGFHATVRAVIDQLALEKGEADPSRVNILPGIVSPADLRHLQELAAAFGLEPTLLPDYADTLDGPAQAGYTPLAPGGTPVSQIAAMGRAGATICLAETLDPEKSGAAILKTRCAVPAHYLPMPIGIRNSDRLLEILRALSGNEPGAALAAERGRLVDAMVDGHKYLSGRRAAVYGEEDLVTALASFLAEIGIKPVLCATGGESGRFGEAVCRATSGFVQEEIVTREGVDFYEIAGLAGEMSLDLVLGNSKGFKLARDLGVPLVRVGFPVHDRFGGQRILHFGHRGSLALYDTIVNAMLERKQSSTQTGYGYL